MALYAILDRGMPFDEIPPLLGKAASNFKNDFMYLEPPSNLGAISVKNIYAANTAKEHEEIVWAWAKSVWTAWTPQHHLVRELFDVTVKSQMLRK